MRKVRFTLTTACKTLFIALAACALQLSLSACSDDEGDNDTPWMEEVDNEIGDFGAPPYAEYAAKYEVTNEEESGFKSIEFTESGNYVIVAKKGTIDFADPEETEPIDEPQMAMPTRVSAWNLTKSSGEMRIGDIIYGVLSGPYTVIDENTFSLEHIGTVRVFYDGNSIYRIEITPINDTAPRVLRSTLYDPLYFNSPKTVSLCRTWDIVRFRYYYIINGKTIADIEGDTYEEIVEKIDEWAEEHNPGYDGDGPIVDLTGRYPRRIMFTQFGTYAVFYAQGTMGISTWAWADIARGILVYSWDNIYDGDTDGNVVMRFRGDKAYMIEAYGENDGFTSFEEGTEITLQEVK